VIWFFGFFGLGLFFNSQTHQDVSPLAQFFFPFFPILERAREAMKSSSFRWTNPSIDGACLRPAPAPRRIFVFLHIFSGPSREGDDFSFLCLVWRGSIPLPWLGGHPQVPVFLPNRPILRRTWVGLPT